MKPSDFPREAKFHDPSTLPFQDSSGMFHVLSHTDVMRVLQNSDEAFSRDQEPYLAEGAPIHMAMEFMWMVEPFTLEGEVGRHDVLRGVVEPWFRNNAVRTLEPVIRRLTIDTVNEVVAKGTGEVNVATEMSSRLSMRVICRLIGMEIYREDWMRAQLDIFNTSPWDDMPPQWEVQSYFWQMVAKRLANPADELLDILVDAWSGGTISDRELLGYLFGFTAAGTDTTGASLANAFCYLAEFDRLDWARDRIDDDEALRRATEEVLRFGTPFPMKPLFVRKDARFGDLDVPAGSVLAVWFAAANRDEAVNGGRPQSDPCTFDPERWPNRHLALGWATHYCLGSELARLETKILLQEALRRLPGLRMDTSKPFCRIAGIVDSVTEAHFTFDQGRADRVRAELAAN